MCPAVMLRPKNVPVFAAATLTCRWFDSAITRLPAPSVATASDTRLDPVARPPLSAAPTPDARAGRGGQLVVRGYPPHRPAVGDVEAAALAVHAERGQGHRGGLGRAAHTPGDRPDGPGGRGGRPGP